MVVQSVASRYADYAIPAHAQSVLDWLHEKMGSIHCRGQFFLFVRNEHEQLSD
jgi:hypothetical protein